MTYDFMNHDFDPALLARAIEQIESGRKFVRGHWEVKAWESKAHEADGTSPILCVEFPNGITDLGIAHVLDRFTDFAGPEVTLAPWHAGLIDNAGFTGVADADTMGSHSGWTESQAYSESVRQALTFGAAATRSISDSVSFSINATVTIQGLFVTSDNVKGATSGTLFSTALFSTPPALVDGNTLTANYTLSD